MTNTEYLRAVGTVQEAIQSALNALHEAQELAAADPELSPIEKVEAITGIEPVKKKLLAEWLKLDRLTI